jgi:hypothetical protein
MASNPSSNQAPSFDIDKFATLSPVIKSTYDSFFTYYNRGLSIGTVHQRMKMILKSVPEGQTIYFWLGLALAEWESGDLRPETKSSLDTYLLTTLRSPEEAYSGAEDYEIDMIVELLAEMKDILDSENPEPREPELLKRVDPIYKAGDCVAFRLENGNWGGFVAVNEIVDPVDISAGRNHVAALSINQEEVPIEGDFMKSRFLYVNIDGLPNQVHFVALDAKDFDQNLATEREITVVGNLGQGLRMLSDIKSDLPEFIDFADRQISQGFNDFDEEDSATPKKILETTKKESGLKQRVAVSGYIVAVLLMLGIVAASFYYFPDGGGFSSAFIALGLIVWMSINLKKEILKANISNQYWYPKAPNLHKYGLRRQLDEIKLSDFEKNSFWVFDARGHGQEEGEDNFYYPNTEFDDEDFDWDMIRLYGLAVTQFEFTFANKSEYSGIAVANRELEIFGARIFVDDKSIPIGVGEGFEELMSMGLSEDEIFPIGYKSKLKFNGETYLTGLIQKKVEDEINEDEAQEA